MPAFNGNVMVITGASAGIGRELARQLAVQKPKLVLAARNAQRLEAVAAECRALGAEAIAVPTDVTDPQQCHALIARAVAQFGRLDTLVNNAGQAMWWRFEELIDLKVVEQIMRVNFLGAVYCTHAALGHLKCSKGRLVTIASIAGLTGVPMLTVYAASKHAVIGFFESLRLELRGSDLSVTLVCPDWVQSELLDRAAEKDGTTTGHSTLDQSQFMTTEECVRRTIKGMAKRKKMVLMSLRAQNIQGGKAFMPWLVDWLSARSIDKMVDAERDRE